MAGEELMAASREPEEWGEVVEPFPEALVFSPGTLRGVASVDQTVSVDEVTLALIAIERYQDGARVRYLAHTGDPKKRQHLGPPSDVLVVDAVARRYRVACLESRRDGNRAEGTLALAPAIPKDVGAITVTVGSLGDARLAGPWVFPIQLSSV
jgi:hypothetical protein